MTETQRKGTTAALWAVGGWAGLAMVWVTWRRHASRQAVRDMPLPPHLRDKLRAAHPQIGARQAEQVERGLRQFFLACAMSGGRFVAMPSKAVDTLWHEFILHTRAYERFCRQAFGRTLHHTPAEVLAADPMHHDKGYQGLRRAWLWSCRDEGIDPRRPDRLPALFAVDAALGIAGGYHYVPDCRLLGTDRGDRHCASSFGCGSSCGGGSSDGGGDGGCGGGCGGE